MPSLIVVGKKDGAELPLESSVTVIGRDRGVTLEIPDFQVSRRHALVVRTDDGCFVKDLGSRNGVLINSSRVPSRRHQRLKNGDVLTLGRTALIYKDVTGAPLEPADVATIVARPGAAPAAEPSPQPVAAAALKAAAPAPQKVAAPAPSGSAVPQPSAPAPRPRFVELAADAEAEPAAPGENAAVRALLRRLEHERVFYRNLALALVTFLMLLVLVLLVFALRRHEKTETGKASPTAPAPTHSVALATPGGGALLRPESPVAIPLGRAGDLDGREFADTVSPILFKTCATSGCHTSPTHGAGELALEPGTDAPSVARNLANVKKFVVPGRPERSALLTKPLRRDEGGEGHGGGDVLAAESPAYQTVRAWIARAAPAGETRPPSRGGIAQDAVIGAELTGPAPSASQDAPRTGHKPLARIAAAAPAIAGSPVVLDGGASVCPTAGCPLRFTWTLESRPQGSRAEIAPLVPAGARFVPDVPGTYVVGLVVADADGTSEPERLELAAIAVTPVVARAALRADPRGRALVRQLYVDLCGRAPTLEEAEKALTSSREDLVARLFAREEPYVEWYEAELAALGLVDDFRPSPEINEIPGHLARKEATVVEAVAALAGCEAFAQRYATPDAFVGAVAEKLLATDARSLGDARKLVEGTPGKVFDKAGRSAADLVRIVVSERAFLELLVRRDHARLVGTEIAPDELATAVARLQDTGARNDQAPAAAFFELERDWVLSPAYVARPPLSRTKSERAFLRTAFQDVIGRTPDGEEERAARRGLRATRERALDSVLVRMLLDSPQARLSLAGDDETFVKAQFERLLAREPKTSELAAFTRALANGTSRELVVRSLLTSPEYFCY